VVRSACRGKLEDLKPSGALGPLSVSVSSSALLFLTVNAGNCLC
jgi:hypothetical protein